MRDARTAAMSVGGRSMLFMRNARTTVILGSSDVAVRSLRTSAMMRKRLRASMKTYKKPDMQQALSMPLSPQEMDNATLVTLGHMGNHAARKEILKRHIMNKDRVNYEQACEKFDIIAAKNRENMYLLSLPYHIGITVALSAGFLSLPMVFHLETAEWFNHHFVTTEVPEPEDLETFLEVGSWTWNWNEPVLGTLSFLLLTLQFARAQIQNLGAKPYTARIKQWRGERLAQAFPEYDPSVLIAYSASSCLYEKVSSSAEDSDA
jgi:hypothetical protein